MNKIIASAVGLTIIAFMGFSGSAANAQSPIGNWKTNTGSTVKIFKCGSRLCGKLTNVPDGQKYDTKNPDKAKRKRPIKGLVIMSMKSSGKNKWSGTLYKRSNGQTYSGSMKMSGANVIKMSGCVLGFVCQTASWSRR